MKGLPKWIAAALAVVAMALISVGGGFLGSRLAGVSGPDLPSGLVYGTRPESAPRVAQPVVLTDTQRTEVARLFQEQFRAVAEAVLPVVVEINVATTVTQQTQTSPFDFFFGTPRQGQPRQFTQRGLGSGVIVARNGQTVYVITNNHVVGRADEIEVVLTDGRTYKASLVGGDENMDLALVSFDTTHSVPIAVLGDSDTLYVGDWVFAVGNPLGFESTVTAGIISAKSRTAAAGSGIAGFTDFIQTDAAINQGNSGGALVNLDGEVIGINTWIASSSGGSIGLGFAIPINNVKRVITDLITSGEVAYSWLGVQVGNASGAIADDLGVRARGALVTGVYGDSPAAASGLLPGDVITRIGTRTVEDSSALVRTVATLTPGDTTPFVVLRDGEQIEVTVRTGRRETTSGADTTTLWPGLVITPLTDEMRERLALGSSTRGVAVVDVVRGTSAATSGLQPGDTITAVNGRAVDSAAAFYREIARIDVNDEVQFRVLREGRQLILGFLRSAA